MKPLKRSQNANLISERRFMIASQLQSRGILDARVLNAMEEIPREQFVPERAILSAYDDGPIEIGYGQTISQPYIAAYMTEVLKIAPRDRVLEIGTGSGYQTAVLAKLADKVYSVEIVEALQQQAKERLAQFGVSNVKLRLGNGWLGWPEEAPFDKIIVTAAPDKMPPALISQLAEDGRLIAPIGKAGDIQTLVVGVKKHGILETFDTLAVRFVPLTSKEAKNEDRSPEKNPEN